MDVELDVDVDVDVEMPTVELEQNDDCKLRKRSMSGLHAWVARCSLPQIEKGGIHIDTTMIASPTKASTSCEAMFTAHS